MIFALTKNLDTKCRNEEPRRKAQTMIFALTKKLDTKCRNKEPRREAQTMILALNQERGHEVSERGT
ncbi:hypothetical protein V511_14810 [Mesotoga sp. Brook.08.YT.4.2.5.1]|nr:hypothetical protein V511_14810 [Mesotoga sp. Brook.08.YT.4.2.5.1]RAO97652.1 hypothetical protein M388_09900 [Mesotoga sp. Brook.08.YT.4.2.5.4.]RDI93343.1 hypothetical protein Q502_06165 [Mesotoga sp. Brook.08.YT.4.2.5.2.]